MVPMRRRAEREGMGAKILPTLPDTWLSCCLIFKTPINLVNYFVAGSSLRYALVS